MNELQQAVERLIEKHGGLRAAARAIDEHYSYLSRLRTGDRVNPSDRVLRKLGLAKETRFRRLNGKP